MVDPREQGHAGPGNGIDQAVDGGREAKGADMLSDVCRGRRFGPCASSTLLPSGSP
jgi:hypothetical protein